MDQLAAVRLDVMGRRAKFKLGQNRPAATHYQIIAELRKRGRFLGQTLGADQAGAPTAAPVVKALRKAKGIDSDLVPSYMVRPEDQPVDTRSIR